MVPVQVTVGRGLFRIFSTRAIAYGSILCSPSAEDNQAVEMLLSAYFNEVDKSVIYSELRNISDLKRIQPILIRNGFTLKDHLNYLINLDFPPEQILQRIGARTRKHIRRGLRRGDVIVEEAQDESALSACYKLLHQTFHNARVPLPDRSLFESAFNVLYPKGMIRFLIARVGNVPAAASIELLHKKTIYGWFGGMDRAFGSYNPNEMLMWDILKWGANNGYQLYDFGGAGIPGQPYGVRDFKAKFGGKLVCFGRNTCIHAPRRFFIGNTGYRLYRRIK
jgi:predicted N-acyltransferase